MSENGKRFTLALPWAALVVAGSGLVAWGGNQTRLAAVEKAAEKIATDQRQAERQINEHNTKIAVIEAKLDTILIAIRQIGDKLEEQERR